AAATPEDIPAFRSVTGSQALLLHWRSFISTFAIALLLDCVPFLMFAWLMIVSAATSRADQARDELAAMSVRELILAATARDMLQGRTLDAQALRNLVNSQLGRDGR